MTLRRFMCAMACLIALLFAAPGLHAQTTTGGLLGVVRDANGGVVPGAAVKATNADTNAEFSAITGESGQYALRGLPVGSYLVTVELQGFRTFRHPDVVVRVNEEVRLDAVLGVGDVAETVTVSGQPSTVDTTTSTLKTVVDKQRIEGLPLNGRNPTQLTLLVPGMQPDTRSSLTSGATYPGVQPVSSSGSRGNTTNYILDGGSNNDHYTNAPNPMPNPDALQEFSVQTNNFSAEYGRQMGAIVNAVTRAGTNQFHGLAFGYLRDHRFNANNFFTPSQNDGLKRHQEGGTFGGPIRRDRTFFFASYQATSQDVVPHDITALVPTAAERQGDFSALSKHLKNPFTGQPYVNNLIPPSDFSPVARVILENSLPLPNPRPGDSPNLLRYGVPTSTDDKQFLARVDHRFSDDHQIYGRIWVSRASLTPYLDPSNVLTSSYGRTWQNTIGSVNDSITISPHLLNNLVVTFNRTNNDNFQIYPGDYSTLGITGVYNDHTPQWYFVTSGYFTINTGDTNIFLRNELQVVDTLRWSTDRHELAMGIDYSHGQGDITNNFRANGRYTFNSSAPFTGDALADFMVGKFSAFEQGIGEYKGTRTNLVAAFVNDNVRVNSKLTLNLGLRWDPTIPYTDVDGRIGGYRPGQQSTVYTNAPAGLVFAGDRGFPDGGYDKHRLQFAPRAGVAYDPFGDGRSSIRAGYGLFYDKPNTLTTNAQADQAPFGTVIGFPGDATNNVVNPYAGRVNPFPIDPAHVPHDVGFVTPVQVFTYSPDMINGRLQAWHVTVEREILPTYLVRVAYAGSHGDRLALGRELNLPVYVVGATTSTTDTRRPLAPTFGSITQIEPTGTSTYQSLQVTLDKRFARGFSVLASYTLSKSLDDSSENKQNAQTVTNPNDINFDWGPANFDRRHRFVTSFLWQIPGHFSNDVLNGVLADWSASGIVTLQSGLPFTILSGVDNARTGTSSQRADQVGDPTLSSDRSRADQILKWFNTDAFVANALGTFGSVGRNAMLGPGYANVDLGVHKTFPITSALEVQFRAEAFNILNRVNLDLPSGNRSSANFGRILTAQDPRILQFALRVSF
jgi:outer membrane receptor protein involved in Fe transport